MVMSWLEPLLRWIHVVAGVIWIGHLYFFNFVNGPFEKTLEADAKRKVVPELRSRALYFFRWGAAFTWVTGFLLLGALYYSFPTVMTESPERHGLAVVSAIVSWLVGFVVYDQLWKSPLGKNVQAGAAISFALLVGYMAILQYCLHFTPKALTIHVGALLATFMFANVWMRIWPNQRRILAAIRAGEPPDAGQVALALQRSRHNTYMSMPMIFFMLTSHDTRYSFFTAGGRPLGWVMLAVIVLVGWGATRLLYDKSVSGAPTEI